MLKRLFPLLFLAGSLWAAEWDLTGGGNWNTAGNWSPPGVPNSSGTDVEFGGIILAPSTITVDGSFAVNSLTFDNANSYTLSGGTLTVTTEIIGTSGSHEIGSTLRPIPSSFPITNNSAGTLTISGNITNTFLSGVNINGTGTTVFSGANTYGIETELTSGTLSVSADNNLGNASITFNGGTLLVTESFATSKSLTPSAAPMIEVASGKTFTYQGVYFSGPFPLTLMGGGSLVFTPTSNFRPTSFTVTSGTLVGSPASIVVPVAVTSPGGLAFNQGSGTFSSVISGTGVFINGSSEEITLTATNTYSGGTRINAGASLSVGSDSNFGTGMVTLTGGTLHTTAGFPTGKDFTLAGSGGTLNVDTGSLDITGMVTGTGPLTKTGPGELELTDATNDYTGGTVVNQGVLTIGADGVLGALSGGITLSGGTSLEVTATFPSARTLTMAGPGTLSVDPTFTYTLSGTVSGSGELKKLGTGTLVLSGANTGFTGGIEFGAGTVSVSSEDNLGSGTLEFNTGTLETTGAVTSANPITLTGSGTFDIGTNSSFSGVITGGGLLTKGGAATLTIDNANNSYSGGITVSAGTLAGSTLSILGNIANSGTVNFNQGTGTYSGELSGTGDLVVSSSAVITTSNTNNSYSGGTSVTTDGTLLVDADSQLGDPSGGLTLNNGTLRVLDTMTSSRGVTLTNTGIFNVSTNETLTLNGTIGGDILKKTGSGILVLGNAGNNTYSGLTWVFEGTMRISKAGHLGTSSSITLENEGVLATANSVTNFSLSQPVTLSTDGGGVGPVGSTELTLSGAITGSTSLTKTGTGTLILSNVANSGSTWTTSFNAGTLSIASDTNLGSGDFTFTGGTLLSTGASVTLPQAISLADAGTFDTANSLELQGAISGTNGSLTKIGTGTLVLTGTNTYSGGTTVTAGTLEGDTDSLQRAITNNSAVTFDQGVAGTYAGAMTGTGSLTKIGAGTLTLTGTNTYSGGTTVSVGTLSGSANSIQGAIATAGGTTVNFNQPDLDIYQGVMSGGGVLTKTGVGTLILTGANTYTGGTTVSGGILAGSPTSIQGDIVDNFDAVVNFNQGTGTYAGVISGAGEVIVNSPGLITFTGVNTFTGIIRVSSGGTLSVASSGNLGGGTNELRFLNTGTLINSASFSTSRKVTLVGGDGIFQTDTPLTLSGKVTGVGRLVKSGASTLTLTGTSNDYTGGTLVSAGTLIGTGATLQGNILNNATVNFDQGTTSTYGDVMSGSGALTKSGVGTLILSGANTYTGGTVALAGTLQGTSTSLQGSLSNSGATVTFDQDFNGIFNGTISGTGSLFKEGTGTLSATGASPFTGTTTINGGEVNLNGSIAGPVVTSVGGTFSGNATVASLSNSGTTSPGNSIGTITIPGAFTQAATGNLIIEVNDAGNTDLLAVTGAATLDGTLTLSPLPGIYSGNEFYTIITSGGGVAGTFSQLAGPPGVNYLALYLANSVLIDLNFSGAILPVPIDNLKGNAKAVADYLFCFNLFPDDPDLLPILRQLVSLSPKEFVEELDQLSPAQFGALPLVVLQNSHLISDLFVTSNERAYWCDETECTGDTHVWIAPVGQWQGQNSIGQQLGFNSRTFGTAIGASHLFSNYLNLTGGLGYTYTDLGWKENGGNGHWNSLYLCPSLGFVTKTWFANILAQGAVNFYNTERTIRFTGLSRNATSSHHSYDILGRVDGGYRFKWGDRRKSYRIYTMPTVRLSYLNIFENSYTESGAGAINLDVDSHYSAFLQPEILIKNSLEFTPGDLCIAPYTEIGYIANIPLTSANYTSRFHKQTLCKPNFTVVGLNETTNQLSITLGLQVTKGCHFTLDVSYDGRFFDQTYINAGKLKFDYRF